MKDLLDKKMFWRHNYLLGLHDMEQAIRNKDKSFDFKDNANCLKYYKKQMDRIDELIKEKHDK